MKFREFSFKPKFAKIHITFVIDPTRNAYAPVVKGNAALDLTTALNSRLR